jgi:hypothetical protein
MVSVFPPRVALVLHIETWVEEHTMDTATLEAKKKSLRSQGILPDTTLVRVDATISMSV